MLCSVTLGDVFAFFVLNRSALDNIIVNFMFVIPVKYFMQQKSRKNQFRYQKLLLLEKNRSFGRVGLLMQNELKIPVFNLEDKCIYQVLYSKLLKSVPKCLEFNGFDV